MPPTPLPSVQLQHVSLPPPLLTLAESVGWVPAPNVSTRGTWDILSTCTITTFFCVATSLHLNIAKSRNGSAHRFYTRLGWMAANTLAPEIMMTIAMTQYLEARILLRDIAELTELYGQPNPGWSMTQAFYYNMRGYIYRPHRGKSKTLKMKHIPAIIEAGLLPLVTTPDELIEEYSKQNRLAKTIAVSQAFWLVLQTTARMVQHLPTSPLEITTCAYVACTLFSWALWLNKPQDVGFSTVVDDRAFSDVIWQTHRRCRHGHSSHSSAHKGCRHQLPNATSRAYRARDKLYLGITWTVTAATFGGLHLLAWGYAFPSALERTLWRASSIAIMALPPLFYGWEVVRLGVLKREGCIDIVGPAIAAVYIGARAYNVLEVFFCLRMAPGGLYQMGGVTWTGWLPHF